jgi:hypothetical protein
VEHVQTLYHIVFRNYVIELFMTLSDFDIIVRPNFRSKRDFVLIAGEYRGRLQLLHLRLLFPYVIMSELNGQRWHTAFIYLAIRLD